MTYSIIMSGGYGTRFWPMSRKNMPKQCLSIFSDKPLVQEIVDVYSKFGSKIYMATGDHLHGHFNKILKDVEYALEPEARNTAACIGLAIAKIINDGGDKEDVVIIGTADHIFRDPDLYIEHLKFAEELARQGYIVQLGIKPTRIETGFGYIELGDQFSIKDDIEAYRIRSFKEKPDHSTARRYIESGNFLWNSGIFISKISVMLEEMQTYMPGLYAGINAIIASGYDEKVIKKIFADLEKISIDYGIIEKTRRNIMIKGNFPWDDIGDWGALERAFPKDGDKNIIHVPKIDDFEGDAKNCIIFSSRRKIHAEMVEGLIIVDTEDATLICDKEKAQDVKKVLDKLNESGLSKYTVDIVKNYSPETIVVDSNDCDVESDGVLALVGVVNLEIRRTKDELIVKG